MIVTPAAVISIHAPTRGATILSLICFLLSLRFQSTLLQEERQVYTILCYNLVRISIHAPTRGATARRVQKTGRYTISIHAPTRGATIRVNSSSTWSIFQSTHLQEERLFSHVIYNLLVKFQSTLLQEERQRIN